MIVEGNDKFISKNKIKNGLEKYLFDKIEDDFLDHLLYSGCTPRGVYSYQKLVLKLKRAMEAIPFVDELDEEGREDGEPDDYE